MSHGGSGMVLDSREHTHTTSSESKKLHPSDPHVLTAEFLNANLKSSDAHVVHRVESDIWSPLLAEDERYKVALGAIADNCVVSQHPHLQGPRGYCDLIKMFKAACPDLAKSIHMMGECVLGDATFVFTKWVMSGNFTGDRLWGVSATNKRFVLHGMSMCEVKGAQIVKMECNYDLVSLAETGFPILSSSLLGAGGSGLFHGTSSAGGGGTSAGGIVSTIKEKAVDLAAKVGIGSGSHGTQPAQGH